jgi:hypothetical protein
MGAWVISYGVDGWGISSTPKSFTMEEVERDGVGDARFITVQGAEATGDHVAVKSYTSIEPQKKYTTGAFLPLFSRERLAAAAGDKELPPTSMVYKLDGTTKGCLRDKSCEKGGPVFVRGIVQRRGLWGVTTDSTPRFRQAANFILVVEDEPLPGPFYLLIAFGGGVLLLLGFLPKRHFGKYVTGTRT